MEGFNDFDGNILKPNYRIASFYLEKVVAKLAHSMLLMLGRIHALCLALGFHCVIHLVLCLVLEGGFMLQMGAMHTMADLTTLFMKH